MIRPETPADHAAVFALNRRAFGGDVEARLVDACRPLADPLVDPLVSLVAEVAGAVVGHILFTPVTVAHNPSGLRVLGLGPMAVDPDHQRTGLGGALVRAGLAACRRLADAVVVLGHADYYPRFGFVPAVAHGLHYRDATFDPHFFVYEITPGACASLSGFVTYLPPFEDA